jgi:hypothetical protein
MPDNGSPTGPWTLAGYDIALSYGVGPDRHLRATCAACHRQVVVNAAAWLAEGLGGLRLTHFEARLRCLCGARSARLEVWPGPPPEGSAELSIYRFR